MTSRRIGLVLAVLLVIAAAVPALQIGPDPTTGEIGGLALGVAVYSSALAIATLSLLAPAWRGGRRSSLAIAILQLLAIVPALPAFLVPADVAPTGAVIIASVSSLLNVVAVGLITIAHTSLLLHAAALAAVLALYAAGVAILSAALPRAADRGIQTLVMLGAVLAFHPILALLRRTVGRTVYGGRADPARTAEQIGALTEIAAVVDETARVLRVPRLELHDGERIRAASGHPSQTLTTTDVPVDAEGRLMLRVGLPPGRPRLHRDERVALNLVARPLGMLIHENELAAELRAARAATAASREEERATIHRELHDGVGPLLTGAAFRADAAANLIPQHPDAALDHIQLLKNDLRTAVAEVRRVVYGLRPVELEQRGLWDALRARAQAVGAELALPDVQPALPAATELALYRIAAESLANAEQHAPGNRTRVEVTIHEDSIRLVVYTHTTDPSLQATVAGVGLPSIHARAEELGGTAQIGPTNRGWSVFVELPLTDE